MSAAAAAAAAPADREAMRGRAAATSSRWAAGHEVCAVQVQVCGLRMKRRRALVLVLMGVAVLAAAEDQDLGFDILSQEVVEAPHTKRQTGEYTSTREHAILFSYHVASAS